VIMVLIMSEKIIIMKKIIYLFLLLITLFSCKKEPKGNSVTLYYYGYSGMGYTYEVPVRFYKGNELVGFFILYSTDKDLKEGIYKYNDKFVESYDIWNSETSYLDFTFFKNKCKWGDKYVTDGYVAVEKKDNIYTFVVSAQTSDGVWHNDYQYVGKVKKEKFETQSNVGGFFAVAHLTNTDNYWERPFGLPSDYNGGMSWVQVEAGTVSKCYIVSMLYTHPDANDPTGTYYINPNANGYYQVGENAYQNDCSYNGLTYIDLASGSITITRVNKPQKFKIDVDVTDINGRQIQGSWDGGVMWKCDYD